MLPIYEDDGCGDDNDDESDDGDICAILRWDLSGDSSVVQMTAAVMIVGVRLMMVCYYSRKETFTHHLLLINCSISLGY